MINEKTKFVRQVAKVDLQQSRRNQCLRQHTNRDTDTLAPRGHGRPYAPRTPNAASEGGYVDVLDSTYL